jgi:hypothetical protein
MFGFPSGSDAKDAGILLTAGRGLALAELYHAAAGSKAAGGEKSAFQAGPETAEQLSKALSA